jgi:23S rRNA maturation mini-RNase III
VQATQEANATIQRVAFESTLKRQSLKRGQAESSHDASMNKRLSTSSAATGAESSVGRAYLRASADVTANLGGVGE